MGQPPAYAELCCSSNFSFLQAASRPEELVARAVEIGYRALALTDECTLAGVVRAHLAAKEAGLHFIVGSRLALSRPHAPPLDVVLLATDRQAYGNLSQLVTLGRRRGGKGDYVLYPADLAAAQGCLAIWLTGSAGDEESGRELLEHFPGPLWLGLEQRLDGGDKARLALAEHLHTALKLPVAAVGHALFHQPERKALHDVLTAIRHRCPVAEAGSLLQQNDERHLRSLDRLARIFPEATLAETVGIAERCSFSLDSLRYEYPEEIVPPGSTAAQHLRSLVAQGLTVRFPAGTPQRVAAMAAHELALIADLGFEPYFLTVHDLVAFARHRGILCQGRGSAANSVVCFALGITEVDPSRMEVLFERFISRERGEPPDIDVDFEHERREEVLQYVYEKYGRHRAALAATVISYRPKSAVRDVARALGFGEADVARLAAGLKGGLHGAVAEGILAEAGFDPAQAHVRHLIRFSNELLGFPRHLSQHVGGMVIARDRLDRLVPVENAAMAERTVIQWDKDDLDALGLLKVDILALGMLTALRKALDLVSAKLGRRLTMADVPAEDPQTYAMIGHGDTVGVFQIESRAQMAMLPRLKPQCFYDLVVEVAIVRPGPIQGKMVHPYLRRRQGLEPVDYPSPEAKEVLERTLGVPIFQEQVMRLAMVAAGFTAGEADELRRSMAAWKRKGGLGRFEERLVGGMMARGYDVAFARRVFDQIQGFGEYGFPESHAASFALLVYVSAWLKCHHPAAFACALLNSQPMGFYAPSQLIQDARRHGVAVLPIDVAHSGEDCSLEAMEEGEALRLGLCLVSGLGADAARRIASSKPYASVEDLARQAELSQAEVKALARAGALASLSRHRRQALWDAAAVEPPMPLDLSPPPVDVELLPPTEAEDIFADYAGAGFSLRRHPLALLRRELEQRGFVTAAGLGRKAHGSAARAAGLVISRQRPGTASGVVFVTLEDETGFINAVVWRDLAHRQRKILLSAALLGVRGILEREGEVVHLVARELFDLGGLFGRLSQPSRDFH